MELKKWAARYFEKICDAQATVETGSEMIVPDLYPDISRIIDCSGQACVKEKTKYDEKIEVSGVLKAGVLYVPEDGNGIARLDVNLPFAHSFECLANEEHALCKARILTIDAHAVNPRKVQVSAALLVEVEGYLPKLLEIAEDVDGNCEVLKSAWQSYMPVAVKDKAFTVIEELELSAAKPPIEEILKVDVRLLPGDVKPVGSKLILKGTAIIRLLYRAGSEPVLAEQEFPFSQILEMEGLEDGANVELDLQLTGLEVDIRAAVSMEARIIAVSLHFNAQAVAWAERHFEAVSDLYSVEKLARPEYSPVKLNRLIDKCTKRQSVRESLEVGEDVSSVVDAQVMLWPASSREEGISCEAVANVLYINEDGRYSNLMRRLTVNCPHDSDMLYRAKASLAGDVTALPSSDGVELRFAVDFELTGTGGYEINAVTGIRVEELPDSAGRPSVVLRRCMKGESLWDIAKRYGATRKDLALANSIEDINALPQGALLLIPRKK